MIKTQKERIDKGRQAFNDEIIRCSESDNIYEAILEWKFIYVVDCYSYDCDKDIIIEWLKDASHSDRFDKLEINYYEDDYGSCICGKHNLRYVFHIQNKINKKILYTGSDCIKKVFPDGSILKEDILLLDKILKSSKRSVKKIREENKSLKSENKSLKKEIKSFKKEIKLRDSLIEGLKDSNETLYNLFSGKKKELRKKIEFLEDEIKSLKDDNTKLSIYKKMYGSEMDKEFDILWEI